MATTEKNSYIYTPEEFGKESFDILFGAPTREDIRVGYIDADRGYVTGRNICDANRQAKLNPGAQFIIKTRKRVRYMNVNEVNSITPEEAFDAVGSAAKGSGIPDDPCKGVEYGVPPGPATVDFMGGGGVGVKGNPVIGRDGSVLAIHMVDGGFGYKYAPLVDVQDPMQIGGGVVARAFLGEVAAGLETYGDESDLEEYFPTEAIDPKTGKPSGYNVKSFCDTQVNVNVEYGRVWTPDGKNVGIWDPTIYSDADVDPFRRKIEAYQAYLAQLLTPWWVTRRKGDVTSPKSVSSSWDKTIPEYLYEVRRGFTKSSISFPVQHWKWGGYYKKDLEASKVRQPLPPLSQGGPETGSGSTNTDLEDVEFNFFVAVGRKQASNGFRWVFRELKEEPFPHMPIYKGEDRYGPHRFVVSPADMKNNRGGNRDFITPQIESLVKKVKVNTTYQVIGEGTTSGYGVEQGLVSRMGFGGHNTEIVGEGQSGKMIFIDLIYSENDDDDMQLGARAGSFTQKNRRPGVTGHATLNQRSLPSAEMYEVNGKRVTNKKSPGGVAYSTTKKVLDRNGIWREEKTDVRNFGRDTYDLFYRVTPEELGRARRGDPESGGGKSNTPALPGDKTGGKGEDTAMTQSFMNKYAISPIPASNERGSDHAGQLFSIQWDQVFPHGGQYHFRGQSDNYCAFWLDNEYVTDLNSYHGKPWEWKPEFTWEGSDDGEVTVKNIRLELRNDPEVEDVIVQQEDGEWVDPEGITDYEEVPFDVFVHVAKKLELWENLQETSGTGVRQTVCFSSLSNQRVGGMVTIGINMTSSGRYVSGRGLQRCAHGLVWPGLWTVYSISNSDRFDNLKIESGKDYNLTVFSQGGGGVPSTDDGGGRCPDSTIALSISANGKTLNIGSSDSSYNHASSVTVTGGYFHAINGSKVMYRGGGVGQGSVEKFILTPLDGPKNTAENVTFTVTSNAGDTNRFRLRAPGQPYDFSISRAGTKTVKIPFGRKEEVHIIGHQGKIKWTNNWRTMLFEDRPGGTDFDDLIVTCSTGRFRSNGRQLNTEYSYKYPHFIPTITWEHDGLGSTQGEIVLTETDKKCADLLTGVDYGVRFVTDGTAGGSRRHGANILDGKSTGRMIAYSVGSVTGPFDDMVVTATEGRFRSKDGTDDWGHFGHFGGGPGGSSTRVDQILWSMPKKTVTPPPKVTGIQGLQFTFESADKRERFSIRSNEIKNDKGNKNFGRGLRWTSGSQKIIRRVRVNTKYRVWASVRNPDAGEKGTRCEQGLINRLGRKPQEESFAKKNSSGKYIFADIIPSDNDNDDMQIGTPKGIFRTSNRHRHSHSPGGKAGRWTYDIEYELKKKVKDDIQLQGSTKSKIQTKEVFCTTGGQWIKPTSCPKGQMWRINEVGDADTAQGFLNEFGVTPFNPREEVEGNPYAGTHKIVWNNVNFPVDADYNIKVAVDDSVELVFEGPEGINLVRKAGFNNGRSTGPSLYTEYFPKGSYKITANLTQSEGGTYSFKALTQEEKEAARQAEYNRLKREQVKKPVTTPVTFNQGSSAGCTNHSSITGLFKITRNGSETRDVEIGKQYNVAISSDCGNHRVKIRIVNNGRTIQMEDWRDNDYNDLVLTCSGGKFHSVNGRFCKYEGGPNSGSADEAKLKAWEANPTISINDIALKGANPMALAIKVNVSYAEAQKIVPRSWYQNPMGVAFTIEAPLPKPPIQKKPIAEGRCPNNPFWTTRFAEDADKMWYPVRNNRKEKNGEWMWSEFMNKYAMSPLPPLAWSGTDFGGIWYTNEWNVNIPYDGYYIFKMLCDDDARFYVKGVNRPEYGEPNLAVSRYKGEPSQVKIKLFEGKGKFRVDVKNRETYIYKHINKKIFSARDWVGQPGESDADWEGVPDPKQFRDVDFDVFASVAREYVLGKEPITNKVCFNSKAGGNATPSGGMVTIGINMTSSGRYSSGRGVQRCAHGLVWPGLWTVYSISNSDRFDSQKVESGKVYNITVFSQGGGGVPRSDDSGGRCPDSTIALSISGGGKVLNIGTSDNSYNHATTVTVTGGYFHSINGRNVKYTGGPAGSGGTDTKFYVTPLDKKGTAGGNVTFDIGSDSVFSGNTFVLRAPGKPYAFQVTQKGSGGRRNWTKKTVNIPGPDSFIGQEVHILVPNAARNYGNKIKFTNNWKTIMFEDTGLEDFDDLMITCSRGRFYSNGRQLDKQYNYRYPHFIPSIDWADRSGGSVEGEIILTNNDNWCGELKDGVDYGVRFTTDRVGSAIHGANIFDGQTTGQKIGYGVGKVRGPHTDMVVTVDKGRFRSKDGTDDWGYFGHYGPGPTRSSESRDQILWSMPKIGQSAPGWNPAVNGLRFTFAAKDGSHRFEIKPNDVKRGVGKRHWNSSGVQKTTRRIKLNTIYNVHASINAFTGNESLDRCEQGFVPKLGRGVFASEQQKWEDTIPNGGQNRYIFAEVIPSQPWEDPNRRPDGDDLQIGATQGTFKHWNKRRHKDAPYTWQKGLGYWTYDLTYEVPWTPPVVHAQNTTRTGTIKDGITYTGPYLFHYVERDWSPYMNKMNVAPIVRKDLDLALYEPEILGTKTMLWDGVRFDHPGDYHVRFLADNIGKLYVNDEKLLDATNNFKGNEKHYETVSIASSGPQRLRVELENSDGSNVFYDNPTGMVLEITKPLKLKTYGPDGRVRSDSWVQNPVAVSMECIPPPCAKIREGKGVVENVVIHDPGNGFTPPEPPNEEGVYPVAPQIVGFEVVKPGINYSPDDKLHVRPTEGSPVEFDLKLKPFGGVEIPILPPELPKMFPPLTTWPDVFVGPSTISPGAPPPPTGVNAQIVPVIEPRVLLPDGIDPETGLPVPPAQIIQVTDLAGIKRTGFYNGKPYYGAVFYKEGVRYAGYYETAGVLIQIYDTLQESIDATVTTPPSAIQRQGTDISSQDPRLDIPGTPQ